MKLSKETIDRNIDAMLELVKQRHQAYRTFHNTPENMPNGDGSPEQDGETASRQFESAREAAFVQTLETLPSWLFFNWVEYKQETYFADVDYNKSIHYGYPVVNLYLCATRALNGIVIKSVAYDPGVFKKSKLSV